MTCSLSLSLTTRSSAQLWPDTTAIAAGFIPSPFFLPHPGQAIVCNWVPHAERALIAKGSVKINLQIMQGNEAVTAFYASLGFSVEQRISMGKPIPQNCQPTSYEKISRQSH